MVAHSLLDEESFATGTTAAEEHASYDRHHDEGGAVLHRWGAFGPL